MYQIGFGYTYQIKFLYELFHCLHSNPFLNTVFVKNIIAKLHVRKKSLLTYHVSKNCSHKKYLFSFHRIAVAPINRLFHSAVRKNLAKAHRKYLKWQPWKTLRALIDFIRSLPKKFLENFETNAPLFKFLFTAINFSNNFSPPLVLYNLR